jgi:hypothetical protein
VKSKHFPVVSLQLSAVSCQLITASCAATVDLDLLGLKYECNQLNKSDENIAQPILKICVISAHIFIGKISL